MSGAALAIRDASADDLPRIVELMRSSLGEGAIPRTEAFFRWKHLEGPFDASPVLLAEDGDRLVGLRAFLRWELRRGGRVYRAVRAVDTATHPDYRGQGIFRRLTMQLVTRMKAEGVDFVFNTPNEKSGPGYIKMGWRTVGLVPVFIRPRLALLGRPLRRDEWGAIGPKEAEALRAASTDERPGEWMRQDAGDRGHTDRGPRYLRWRYVAIPGIDYGAVWDPDHHLIVFRRRLRRGLRELTVCEFLVAPGRRALWEAGRALHRAARGAETIGMSAAVAPRLRGLARLHGFVPMSGPVMVSRPLASPPIEGFDGWLWSLGDLELF